MNDVQDNCSTLQALAKSEPGQIVLVLQGGGALGSYQAGVYQALAEHDLHPDWVAGISIGAINSALIAGNPPEKRVERLREFWETVTEPTLGVPYFKALETAEDGITCNAICPGYVYTPLVEAQIDGQAKAHGISREKVIRDVLLAQQPNKHFASVEELGALTVFLASDAAASITGIALPVDGGWTAH